VAASVFGNPSYVLFRNTTDNRLESTAFKRNEALLIPDELSEMSPAHKAGELAYKLANGSGRARLDKDCSDREILKWRLLFLSNGRMMAIKRCTLYPAKFLPKVEGIYKKGVFFGSYGGYLVGIDVTICF
jgi:uncharacterized protein (DUF927 family)